MGSKPSKTNKGKEPTNQNNDEGKEFAGKSVESLLKLESDSDIKRRWKLWLKKKGSPEEKGSLFDFVECYEAIEKRRTVYTSGQRCGDTEEVGQERLYNNGQSIVEKFLTSGASRKIELPSDIQTQVKDGDLSKLDAFDKVSEHILSHVSNHLESK